MQTAVECNDSSNSSSNSNISNSTNSAESSADSTTATPYMTTITTNNVKGISATERTAGGLLKFNDADDDGDDDDRELENNADIDDDEDDEVQRLVGKDDVDNPMTFIKGTTLAEELASVLAQEIIVAESEAEDEKHATATTTTTNNTTTNNSVINHNVSVRLPHNINTAEYLGSVIEQMSVTPSPTPQASPQKQSQVKQKPAVLAGLKELAVPAAQDQLQLATTNCNSSSSNSNSNSNSNSTTSSVIATPILTRNSNGLKQDMVGKEQQEELQRSSTAPTKPISLSVKTASMMAFDEKFLSASSAAAAAGREYFTTSASSTSASSSTTSSTSASIATTPSPAGAAKSSTSTVSSSAALPAESADKPAVAMTSDLLHWKDMPQYLQFNPYVLEGYRPLQTFKGCLLSLFYWHNETINILTHAIPIVYILAIVPGLMPWEKGYRFLSFCHVFGSVAPWCGSFIYHLFMNIERGENVYYRLLKLDMVGIWVSQSFGALPLVTATSHCFTSKWKWLVILTYCLMSLWGLYKAITASSPWQRRLCFALPFTMRSVLTFLRTLGVVGGNSVALPHVYLQDVVSILGGAIGAMRIPEKWFPGLVDFYLNSHNIMHVLVVVAVYSMHKATVKDFEWMSTANCDAFTNTTTEAIENSFIANVEL